MYWKGKGFTRFMSGLSNLNKRLQYFGGDAEGRLQQDKLRGLKRALFNSYQACTVELEDGREFKCLINPNKNTTNYDNKILSIPYEDICLNSDETVRRKTSEGIEEIGICPGDIVFWKETNSYWLVFLEYLEEDAYFRAQIRRCDQQIEINGRRYWVYIRGPVETSVTWNQKAGVEWNDLNYSLVLFIKRNQETLDYFHRFSKIKIIEPDSTVGKTWQVVGRDPYYGDGIIQIFLDEYFENTIAEMAEEEKISEYVPEPPIDATGPYIDGPRYVKKYDTVTYAAYNFTENGAWYLKDGDKDEVKMNNNTLSITFDVLKSSGSFKIKYKGINEEAEATVTLQGL